MNDLLLGVGFTVLGYLSGSVPYGLVLPKLLLGVDVRTIGSGNIGATNAARAGGKALGVAVFVLDVAKAVVPILAARALTGEASVWTMATAVAAFAGHLFPAWLGFKGGKGVATALGVLLGISGWLALATVVTFVIIVAFFRWVSFASLIAAAFAPFFYVLTGGVLWEMDPGIALAIALMAGLLAWRHAANIGRLIKGTEPKLGARKKP